MGRLAGIARREKKRAPMQTLDTAQVTPETGVANDFRGRPGKRQVTVLSARAWQAACADIDRELPWTTRRANLFVEDIDLPQRAGDRLRIGTLELEVTMETEPCSRMDEQAEGLRRALAQEWRGGVACRVLQGGTVRLGDSVELLSRAAD